MEDPWKYLAFPVAAVAGYSVSMIATEGISSMVGLPDFATNIALIAFSGLLAGFVVDGLIPAYLQKIRGDSDGFSGSTGDSGFDDMDGDVDFD
ncbi:MAG: hypothetical protein ABEJ98_00015 [Candidatus Nanohaloarchaea archaeon]